MLEILNTCLKHEVHGFMCSGRVLGQALEQLEIVKLLESLLNLDEELCLCVAS